ARYVFAFDENDSGVLAWADHVFANSVTIPRSAFVNGQNAPVFFITSFSRASGGSQTYHHRTDYKSASLGWEPQITRYTLMANATIYDQADMPLDDAAYDEDLTTRYLFPIDTAS